MSDERTRTTKEVRDGYAYDGYSGDIDPYYELRFDRWLAAHDTATRTAALEEAAGIISGLMDVEWELTCDTETIIYATYTEAQTAIRAAKAGAQ